MLSDKKKKKFSYQKNRSLKVPKPWPLVSASRSLLLHSVQDTLYTPQAATWPLHTLTWFRQDFLLIKIKPLGLRPFKKSTADHVMSTVLLEESLKKKTTTQKKAKNSFQDLSQGICGIHYTLPVKRAMNGYDLFGEKAEIFVNGGQM